MLIAPCHPPLPSSNSIPSQSFSAKNKISCSRRVINALYGRCLREKSEPRELKKHQICVLSTQKNSSDVLPLYQPPVEIIHIDCAKDTGLDGSIQEDYKPQVHQLEPSSGTEEVRRLIRSESDPQLAPTTHAEINNQSKIKQNVSLEVSMDVMSDPPLSSLLYKFSVTTSRWALGYLNIPSTLALYKGDYYAAGRARLNNSGIQITKSDVIKFISQLRQKHIFNAIHAFYENIRALTLDEIKIIIDDAFKDFGRNFPMFIPVVYKTLKLKENSGSLVTDLIKRGLNQIESKHIVLITIANGVVEYYDSKAVQSQMIPLGNNTGTLRDVLEHCKIKFGAERIEENDKEEQYDINSCGIFVCRRIYCTLNKPSNNFSENSITEFRSIIKEIAYPQVVNQNE